MLPVILVRPDCKLFEKPLAWSIDVTDPAIYLVYPN
jgi:hypothetical protein